VALDILKEKGVPIDRQVFTWREAGEEPKDSPSAKYRDQLNSQGSPSEIVASGYRWSPGTELHERAARERAAGSVH
jgi:hypothetical protein